MCTPIRLFYPFLIVTFTSLSISASELIPFSLPWHDGNIDPPSILNLDDRDLPAGKQGFIHILNGHFTDGEGKRIRLLGVNMSFSGNYPDHSQADSLAGRMAKYGINCVRFHHTDTLRAPNGIWKEGTSDKQALDATNLDRMDYFIHALKQKGIYSDINLKIGREVIEGDGFTDVDRLPVYDKGPDHYHPRMIELQKNYARDLLTHLNPYTGNRYIDEPALAIVEINNESGLVGPWAGYALDNLPSQYLAPLQTDWNAYLKNQYSNTENLRAAWTPQSLGTGKELLTQGLRGWTLEQRDPGKGEKQILPEGPNGEESLRLNVIQLSTLNWHIQTNYRGLKVKKGGYYKIRLSLRAVPNRRVSIGLKMNHDPWQNLDDYKNINLTGDWQTVNLAFTPSQDDENARLDITGLGDTLGTLWIANPSMIDSHPEGLPGEQSLEKQNIAWIPRNEFGQRSPTARHDWMDFLIQRETEYYRDMNQFLKNELQLKSLVAGTQLSFGTIISQMENDFIDIHGYWCHPVFPNRSWDAMDWTVSNQSIVSAENNSLERMMMSRLEGMPFTCTEYNHPAPNTYSSEVIPLMAAYAAFQDWDGIFFYSYSHDNKYEKHSINNFFDICGHTPKMMALPAAYNMFIRGDIMPARQTISAALSPEEYKQWLIDRNGSLWFTPMNLLEIPGTAPYQHQTVLRFDESRESTGTPSITESRHQMKADTGELLWNQYPSNRSYVLIRSQKTKGFVGFVNGMTFDLGDGISLEIGETRQNWANILLTYLGTNGKEHRWLLTATGYHENTGMKWKNEDKNSVGNQWGEGPPLVEPIPLRLAIAASSEHELLSTQSAEIYSLNNVAEPETVLSKIIQSMPEGLTVNLLNSSPSLWYEIRFPAATQIKTSRQY